MKNKKNKFDVNPDSPSEAGKRKQTNKKAIKKDIDEAKAVDPELGDRIEGLTDLDQAKR